MTEGVDAFVAAHLPLVRVPGIPEIVLHLATPASRVGRLDPDGRGPAPYWAYRWGGGLALARFLLDRPETVAGRRVRDLGSGSGLVAIAAALAGATEVTGADSDPNAAVAARRNAGANRVGVRFETRDAFAGPVPDEEVILAGDLFYDGALARRSTAFLTLCVDAGRTVLVGDPLRAPLPLDRLARIAEVETIERDGQAPVRSGVFRFV